MNQDLSACPFRLPVAANAAPRRDEACLSGQKLSLLNGSVEFTNLIELMRKYPRCKRTFNTNYGTKLMLFFNYSKQIGIVFAVLEFIFLVLMCE